MIEPGLVGSTFAYDNGGRLISKTLTDAVTGKVSMQVGHLDGSAKWVSGYDEMGRAKAVADTDNGHSYSTVFTVDALQRPVRTVFGSAGNASVNYDYAGASGFAPTESAGALRTMTLKAGDQSTVLASTSYAYDPNTKRLATISVNGVTFMFNYFSGSDQVQSVVALPSGGGSGVTTTYLRDTSDLARLTRVGVSGAQGSVFTDTVDSYSQQDQINGRTVNRRDANDDGTLANAVATAYGYTYDAGRGDALTNVSVTVNGAAAAGYGYAYDQVGNFTGNASLGVASSVNQYSALTYNGRGDVTDDGTYAYGYDANDRLITVTPHDTAKTQLRYGYDSQGRRLWKTAYMYAGGAWAPSYTRHYLWDGNNLVAELDGSNAILTGYTWGPTGLLAVTDYSASGGPKTYLAVEDLSRNVEALVDPTNGVPVASFHYEPYGKVIGMTGPAKELDGFAGQEEQSDREDRNLGFSPHPSGEGDLRVVNYITNSFMQRDATGELAGGLNLYQFDGGDAVNKSDPTGHSFSVDDPNLSRGSGSEKQLRLFPEDIAFSGSVQIGWVYTATGLYDGSASIYIGKATLLEKRLFVDTDPNAANPRHDKADFLRSPETEISVRPIYGDPTVKGNETAGKALNRAQRIQEQTQMNLKGWTGFRETSIGPNGEQFLNSDNALTSQKLQAYQELYNTSMGSEQLAKQVGLGIDRATLAELDRAVGRPLSVGNGTVGLDVNASFGLLQIGDMLFNQVLDDMHDQYAWSPRRERDDLGEFELSHTYSSSAFFGIRYNEHWYKEYVKGREGPPVEISKEEYDLWKEVMENDWGYMDWKGSFVPGVLRHSLPEVKRIPESTQLLMDHMRVIAPEG